MKIFFRILRYLFAAFYIFSALGYLFGFMHLPKMDGMAQQLISAMASSYLMSFVKLTELAGGVLLLFSVTSPLALAVLAPVTLNIFAFDLILNPSLLVLALIMLIIHLILVWNFRERFLLVFRKETLGN